MTAPGPTAHEALARIAAEVETLRSTAECGVELATRLDTVEHELVAVLGRVETLVALAAVAPPAGAAPTGTPCQHPTLAAWVDDVFAPLAARHQARWCPRWSEHLEAVSRLQLLWRTWETAHTEPANYAARDEWTRVVFDHHTPWLLDREGPFAGCTSERCAPAPRLPQRALPGPASGQVAWLAERRRGRPVSVGAAR
jgi:hypothetical protein